MSMNPPLKKAPKQELALATARRELARSRELIIAIGGVILGYVIGAN
jgi:hypothetical protein